MTPETKEPVIDAVELACRGIVSSTPVANHFPVVDNPLTDAPCVLTDDHSVETCKGKFDNLTKFTGEPFIPGPEVLSAGAAINKSLIHLAGRHVTADVVALNNGYRIWTADAKTFNPILAENLDSEKIYGVRNDWAPVMSDADGHWWLA